MLNPYRSPYIEQTLLYKIEPGFPADCPSLRSKCQNTLTSDRCQAPRALFGERKTRGFCLCLP